MDGDRRLYCLGFSVLFKTESVDCTPRRNTEFGYFGFYNFFIKLTKCYSLMQKQSILGANFNHILLPRSLATSANWLASVSVEFMIGEKARYVGGIGS